MVWYAYGAPVPLELSWPGGIGVNVLALAALAAAVAMVAISAKATFLRVRRAAPLLSPVRREKGLGRATA